MAPGGMAPDAIPKLMAVARGDKVITNSIHLSGAVVPQQLPSLEIGGDETQAPLGLEVRFTVKLGVIESQLLCAKFERGKAKTSKRIRTLSCKYFSMLFHFHQHDKISLK